MLPDRVSNPGPLTYESGALPIALRGEKNYLFAHRLPYYMHTSVHLSVIDLDSRDREKNASQLMLPKVTEQSIQRPSN